MLVRGVGDYERWGGTIDDALGEAFDNAALSLAIPAGRRWSKSPNQAILAFNSAPALAEQRLDFSFSSLQTAILFRRKPWHRCRIRMWLLPPASGRGYRDCRHPFPSGAERFKAELPMPSPAGRPGVAANQQIAAALLKVVAEAGAKLVVPPIALCTDNGAMVAWAGAERLALGRRDGLEVVARPRWPLDTPDMKVDADVA